MAWCDHLYQSQVSSTVTGATEQVTWSCNRCGFTWDTVRCI